MPERPAEPLFSWLKDRSSGVLLHPTALPCDFGVGTLGAEADRFLEFLASAGFEYWQMCPLGPTGYGNSPYQCFSAFAGNPYLIDLLPLAQSGLVPRESVSPLLVLDSDRVDYGGLWRLKTAALAASYDQFAANPDVKLPYGDFGAFKKANADWLDDFAMFQALKDHFDGRPWWEWPSNCRVHGKALQSPLMKTVADRAEAHRFFQYLFFGQWCRLKAKAAELGISIIGDIPIFVAMDSADVWARPGLFQLNPETGRPIAVAGVPPDYFSEDGQLWGNPLFDWPAHAKDGYAWWMRRLGASFDLYDVVRIDHFRGFESYWAIPAGAPNARVGKWEPGPGIAFFERVREEFPDARIIAEDLGIITPEVSEMLEATGLPGMAVLQFAFNGDDPTNPYLPHNQSKNSVCYTGTHDNATTREWYSTQNEPVQDQVRRYFRISGQDIAWDLVRAAFACPARLAVVPLQDLLNIGAEGRFNTPGAPVHNWEWRFRAQMLEQLHANSADYLRSLGRLYGRIPAKDRKPAND